MLLNSINLTQLAQPIIFTLVVVAVYAVCNTYVKKRIDSNELEEKKRWIEQLPSLVSTTGVLFTFLGITIGLLGFKTDDIVGSIPKLLQGMSTAFFTSLAGMLGSMALTRKVSNAYDKIEKGVSEPITAASMIVNELIRLNENNDKNNEKLLNHLTEITSSVKSTDEATSSLLNTLESMTVKQQNMLDIVDSSNESISSLTKTNTKRFEEICTLLNKVDTSLKQLDSKVGEIEDSDIAIVSQNEEISSKITTLTDKIHSEVIEIEDNMDKTNRLLSDKFDEFTELLKKSNTEALVEVMKRVTEEFQKQMGHLINKLVQENFDQLNKSVERLNSWQIENKEMIASLTMQYKEMSDNFSSTSTILTQVGSDTKNLVSDGGKLKQLIEALNKVLLEDQHFIQLSSNLAESADLSKKATEEFHENAKSLNEWVKKQRNFVESVQLLIDKLEQINKINDYSDQFWKETRQGMNDAISIIKGGVQSLNKEIGDLDEHFYERLNATLSELDTCIQAMIKGR